MAFGLILAILATLFAANAILLARTMVRTYLAHERIKRRSRGLRSADGFSLIFGHIKSYVFRPNLSAQVAGLHEKYGKTFIYMMGHQPMCSSIDLELIKKIAVDESQLHTFRMDVPVPIKEMVEDNIITARDNWRTLRRAIAPALRPNRFKTPNVTREVQNSIGKLIQSIERKLMQAEADGGRAEVELDADDHLHRYSLDLVLNCLYKQDNLVDFHAKRDRLVDTVDQGLNSIFSNPFVPFVIVFHHLNPIIDWFIWHFTQLGRWRKQVLSFIKHQTQLNLQARREMTTRLKTRKPEESEKEEEEEEEEQEQEQEEVVQNLTLKDGSVFNRNMIDYVIDQYHSGKLSTREYYHTTCFLFTAADKTSAEALASMLYYMALNEDIQDRLREHIRLHGPESDYLLWSINETMRLSPPAPIGCSRTIARDIELQDGRLVPAGTCVVTPIYAIHRLREYWGPDAHRFKPERFADQRSFHPCQFMPFGAGSRQCPGKEFALHEMKLVLCELLTRYKFTGRRRLDEGFDSPFYIFTIPHEHIIVQVSRV